MNAWAPGARPMLRSPGRMKYDRARQADLLLLPERVVQLNHAAGAILWLCNGRRTTAQIVSELETRYGQFGLEEDVLAFLGTAVDQGWVEACP